MEIRQIDARYVAPTYRRNDIVLERGQGSRLYDETGKEYLDLGSGIAVNGLGMCNPAWVQAVQAQTARLAHTSNLYYSEPCALLARALCERTGMERVFFSNSGAEANECAIKCARKYSYDRYGAGRGTVLSLRMSFHGRTIATLTATGQDAMHDGFDPLPGGFRYVPADDIEALRAENAGDVCAVICELVQGEGGVRALGPVYVRALRALCDERDWIWIADEVQTGNGRTGTLYAYQQYGVAPDVVTTAKGLGGGLPIGATMFNARTCGVLGAGAHGSTFGGNPIVCAGALAVLDQIDDDLLAQVRDKAAYIRDRLAACKGVRAISGMGLMIGIETDDASAKVRMCAERGLLVLTAKDKLRLLPALNIPQADLERAMDILTEVLA